MDKDDFNEVKILVTQHDKAIDKMAMGIEHLAQEVGSTNRKLSDIIDVIGKQNLLMEKFSNLEVNIKTQFDSVHAKVRDIEQTHAGNGCSAMKLANKNEDEMKKDIEELSKTTAKKFDKIDSNLTWIVRLIIGGLVSGAIGTLVILARGVH